MSRRIVTYQESEGFAFWNMVASIGSFVIAAGVAMFLWNVFSSTRNWRRAGRPDVGPDPWDARGLEWMTASPVPEHNFDSGIEVDRFDEFWHRKYGRDENGRIVRAARAEEIAHDGSNSNVHLPSPSYWPLVMGVGIMLVGYGLIFNLWIAALGVVAVVGAMYGWCLEPADDPDVAHGHGDGDNHDGQDGSDGGDGSEGVEGSEGSGDLDGADGMDGDRQNDLRNEKVVTVG